MLKVFITGASSGIGAALARAYAAQGATLGLYARRQTALDEVLATLPKPSQPASQTASQHRTYIGDVTDLDALRAAARDFVTNIGCPDVVIANAGISVGTLTDYADDIDAMQQVFDTNVLGMAKTFHAFMQPLRQHARTNQGSIASSPCLVGIASVAGIRGLPGSGAYSASKAAAIAYCESLRVELQGSGIQVLTLCPGFIRTPMTAKNPYRMPFMLDAEVFAQRAVRAIAAGRSYAVIPWQMGLVAKGLRLLPNWLYDRAFRHAGRKPRRGEV
jgi:NAD(P)-dependent dehydrogenase (short-subunit alcohol dehydrogenase family)